MVTVAALAAACAGQGPAPDPRPPSAAMPQVWTKGGPVVFVVGGRQERPAPVMTGSMQTAAAKAVHEGSAIGLVDLDGRPRVVLAGAFSDPGANPLALQAARQHYLSSLTDPPDLNAGITGHPGVPERTVWLVITRCCGISGPPR
jgi:hypothetical protein